jgi:hypothetical protein
MNIIIKSAYFEKCIVKLLEEMSLDIPTQTFYDILEDYNDLNDDFEKSSLRGNRKSSLNSKYVLYQLLQRHGYEINFTAIKSVKSKHFHDEVTKKLFEKQGWEHFPSN